MDASNNATNMTAILSSGELEALVAQCRDASFRTKLAQSPLWTSVAATVQSCIDTLDAQFKRSGNASHGALTSDRHAQNSGSVDDDDDGLSYSFSVEKGASMDELSGDRSSPMVIEVADVQVAIQMVEQATSAFRFLRNACVASPLNQGACNGYELIHKAHDLVMRCCIWADVDEPALASAIVLMCQVALQFSVNAITGQVSNQATVWKLYFPDDFQKLLVECQEHRKVVAFAVALLLNCVNKQYDDDRISQHRTELVEARNVIITLLQRCLTKPSGHGRESAHDITAIVSSSVDEEDPAFEWLCLLFKVLFEAGYSKHLYNAVGAHLLSKLWSRVTPEQLILLRMFTMWMTSHRSTAKALTPEDNFGRRSEMPVKDEASFVELFSFVAKTWEYVSSEETEDRPEEADETRKIMWQEFENEAKLLLLNVLGELTLKRVVTTEMNELSEQLLRSLMHELHRVWEQRRLGPPSPPRPGSVSSSEQQDARSKLPSTEPLGYRSALIRVMGNMAYRHSDHQDLVREGGFLPLFLNHCNIDEANPLLREWSLVALRNLCEGNIANQEYINALRPQGIDKGSIDLDSINVDAKLDDDGKLQVTRKSPQ